MFVDYSHQKEAIELFKDRDYFGLFLDMGLGKSRISLRIAAHKALLGQINTILIIAPNNVHEQWAYEQVPRWFYLPYRIAMYGGKAAKRHEYTRKVLCPARNQEEMGDEDYIPSDSLWHYDTNTNLAVTACGLSTPPVEILCCNVDTFSSARSKLIFQWCKMEERKVMVILDESTSIKNLKATKGGQSRTKRAGEIVYGFCDLTMKRGIVASATPWTVARAILTGTPVTNTPLDAYAQFEFLKPGYWDMGWEQFKRYYTILYNRTITRNNHLITIKVKLDSQTWWLVRQCADYAECAEKTGLDFEAYTLIKSQSKYEGPYRHLDHLVVAIRDNVMIRTLDDCVDMKSPIYVKQKVVMTDKQRKVYEQVKNEFVAMAGEALVTVKSQLTLKTKLAQITSGFVLNAMALDEHESVMRGKSDQEVSAMILSGDYDVKLSEVTWIDDENPKLERLLLDVEESDKPVIICCRFSAESELIYKEMELRYPGEVGLQTGWKKVGEIRDFQEGRQKVLVANTHCIAKGFNLQNSHKIFFFSNSFSLEDRLQAEGRIRRIGQEAQCIYVDYICTSSVDSQILKALHDKKSMLEYVQEEGKKTKEEIEYELSN